MAGKPGCPPCFLTERMGSSWSGLCRCHCDQTVVLDLTLAEVCHRHLHPYDRQALLLAPEEPRAVSKMA